LERRSPSFGETITVIWRDDLGIKQLEIKEICLQDFVRLYRLN
jgi:hypothetical protein